MRNLVKSIIFLLGLVVSMPLFSQNSWNTSAKFTGANYISHMNSNVNNNNSLLTVEFWIKPKGRLGDYSIIGKDQFRIMIDAGKVRVQVNNSTILYSTLTIDTVWTHVAVTFSANNDEVRIFINGVFANNYSSMTSAFNGTSDSLLIGKSPYLPNFEGELDEVRIWKTVRSGTEIANTFRNHIGWYSNAFYDNNLLFVETYEFDVHSPGFYMPYGGANGIFGGEVLGIKPSQTVIHNNSMFFNGSSYLEAASTNDPNVSLTGPMTVECWVYSTSIITPQTILSLNSGGTGGYKLMIESSGKVSWYMNQVGISNTILQPNTWYHIAVVCENPSAPNQIANIYINGKQDAGYNFSQLAINTGALRIGANHSGGDGYSGYIDDVRISNYAKTAAEIVQTLHTPINYENRPTAPRTTVAYNLDGNIYSGTRTGFSLKNFGARFSYFSETVSPLFHTGYGHTQKVDSFVIRNSFLRIPEAGTAGYTTDTLNFNQDFSIDGDKMNLFFSLNHATMQDLRIELISPFNDSIVLFDQNNSKKGITCIINNQTENKINMTFVDYSPVIGSLNSFSKFNGKSSKGIWKLKITDLNNGNTGVLNSWGLNIFGNPFLGVNPQTSTNGSMLIYPNPTSSKSFSIQLKDLPGEYVLNICDITGKCIFEDQVVISGNELNVRLPDTITSGLYLINLKGLDGVFTSRLLVK